jgi:saccharopepsin
MYPSLAALLPQLQYAIGWAFGHIAYAPVQFLKCVVVCYQISKSIQNSSSLCSLSVTSQAFVDASSANNPALAYGGFGVLGLGFTHLSVIDSLLNSTHQSTGGSFLYNLFLNNSLGSNFMTFFLQRSTETADDDIQGSFSIGIHCASHTSGSI